MEPAIAPQTQPEHCPWCDSPITREKFDAIQARIREQEGKKFAEHRRTIQAELRTEFGARAKAAEEEAKKRAEARVAEITAERDAALQKAKKVEEQAEEKEQKTVAAAVTKAREVLEKDHETQMAERAAENAREREKLQKKFSDFQRQLEKKTANDLGEGAKLDLYETLRDAFPDDRITRIGKGQPGADIKVEVRYKGEVCGAILVDSKNRKAWQNRFAEKLRTDQIEADAEHAILATTAFPSGKKELWIESDVILASPARVCALVQLLRNSVIKLHRLGLSNEKRAEKREALYQFITSETYQQKLEEVDRLAGEFLDLDVEEKRQHDRTWKRRGQMARQQQNALGEVEVELAAILERGGDKE